MVKRIVWSLSVVAIISVFYVGFTFYKDFTQDTGDQQRHNLNNEEQEQIANTNDTNDQHNEEKKTNPFNQKIQQAQLSDKHIRNYIHKMSHQKITADAKWGFYLITNERIDWLLDGLEKTDEELKNKDIYKDILKRWRAGDFSKVDQDHNAIWRLQDGTIGQAEGIMSEEEEKKYIENTREGD